MQKIQSLALIFVLIVLVGYLTFQKLAEETEVSYQENSSLQHYNTADLPKQLFFAGEEVPLSNPYVARRLGVELWIQTRQNPTMAQVIERANYWLPEIDTILKKYNIPSDFKYLAIAESNLLNVNSPAGAAGFWQLVPVTAEQFGLTINAEIDERYNPEKSTEAACKYLRYLYGYFDNWTSVAASYNSGAGYLLGVQQFQREKSVYKLFMNPQTAGYVFRVLAFKQLLEHQEEYGYKVGKEKMWERKFQKIIVTKSISNLVTFARTKKSNYFNLKKYNPWINANSLTITKKNKQFTLILPQK
ncbi:MAG: lytic transglycosylase domain-containing protein [Verrucomicrobia bacterium]|nr:lytic transglycosylase domain-containing protein [Cytophagales bacterium]